MLLARIAALWAVVLFVTFGAWLLLAPGKLGTWVDVEATSPMGRTEIRAFYGGAQLGLAAFTLLALTLRTDWLPATLAALACVNLAIVACRLLGISLDGSGSTGMWTILAIEAATGVLAAVGSITASSASS